MPKRSRTRGDSAAPWTGQAARFLESAAVLDQPGVRLPTRIGIAEAASVQRGASPGRLLVKLIQAGWNSSGTRYYPAAMLERDGPTVCKAGVLNFVDHATESQDQERPEGSIKDLASVQASDAWWDAGTQSLMAEVRLFAPWREAITDMADVIGMSIRADGLGEIGEAEGRTGLIVNQLTRMQSVDYVTRPGAGGGIVSVLESDRAVALKEARTLGAWLESRLHLCLTQFADEMYGDGRLTRDERIVLANAIGEGLQAWAAVVDQNAPQLYQRDLFDEAPPAEQPVAVAEDDSAPATNEPATAPADTGITEAAQAADDNPPLKEEPAMSGTAADATSASAGTASVAETAPSPSAEARALIAESALRESQARITVLEAQAASLAVERDTARGEVRRMRNVEAARGAVTSALSAVPDLPAPARARIAESITVNPPTTDAGDVDTAALQTAVTRAVESEQAYIASIRESAGVGTPTGLGSSGQPVADVASWQTDLTSRFARLGLSESAAVSAARR